MLFIVAVAQVTGTAVSELTVHVHLASVMAACRRLFCINIYAFTHCRS